MKCVRIGFGKIAQIHHEAMTQLGIETLGVIETDPERLDAVKNAGLQGFATLEAAGALRPDFYDICTPTHAHVSVLKTIIARDPNAHIFIEKPICDFKDLTQLKQLLAHHAGQIVVSENYVSSRIISVIKTQIASLELRPTKVIVEMTKHRGQDYLAGRFVDREIGALGYEGSHLAAIVAELGSDFLLTERVFETDIDSINLNELKEKQNSERIENAHMTFLPHQGGAFTQYLAKNGCVVELYTSMAGIIGYPCPPYARIGQVIGPSDNTTRYRILRVDGVDKLGSTYQIVGFFEPIVGMQRNEGVVLIFKNWMFVKKIGPLEDNTMSQHITRALLCFSGAGPNPYPVQKAMANVVWLHDWASRGWLEMNDTDLALGSEAALSERCEDARRFTFPHDYQD